MHFKVLKIHYLLVILTICIICGASCEDNNLLNPGTTDDSISGTVTFTGNEPEPNGNYWILIYDSTWTYGIPKTQMVNPTLNGNKYTCSFDIKGLSQSGIHYVGLAYIKNNPDKVYILGVYDCGINPSCITNPRVVSCPSTGVNFNSFLAKNSALLEFNYWGELADKQKIHKTNFIQP